MTDKNLPVTIDSFPIVDDIMPASLVERNKINGFQDLDPQRRAFCITYVSNNFDHRKAASTVGFSPSRGINLKKEPLIAAYINVLLDEYMAESIVTKQTLDTYLDQLQDIAMGEVEVNMLAPDGNPIIRKKFHPDLVMKIYAERAKLHKIVEDENGKGAPVNIEINIGDLTGGGSVEVAPIVVQGEDYTN